MVANPLTIGGVNALSPAPHRARSASPDLRNIPPRATAWPARGTGISRGRTGAIKLEMLGDLPGGLIDDHGRNQVRADRQASSFGHPGLLDLEQVQAAECGSDDHRRHDVDRARTPERSSPASDQAARADAMARWRNRADNLATAGSSQDDPGPKSSTSPPRSWRKHSAFKAG